MCLCDETSGWRGHGTEGDQSATNHCLWVRRTVYAIKKARAGKNARARRSGRHGEKLNESDTTHNNNNNNNTTTTGGHIRRLLKILPRGRRLTVIVELNYHTCPSTRSCRLSLKSPQKISFGPLQVQVPQKSVLYAPPQQNTLALAALLAHAPLIALKLIRAVIHAPVSVIP